jgi:phage terminase large subunit GpA-like protein
MIPSPAQQLACSWAKGLRMAPALSVADWADRYRYVAPGSSAITGLWQTSNMPQLKYVMDVCSPQHACRDVVIMAASQTFGKTEVLLNVIGHAIAHEPMSVLVVVPSAKTIDRLNSRFNKTVECTPALRSRISLKSRDGQNTKTIKDYTGGTLYFASSESPADLASIPVPLVIQDEVDRFPVDVDGEGSPVDLADTRATSYGRRAKFIKCSTPTIKSLSVIDALYQDSSRHRYHIPCPHCNETQTLEWRGLKWERGREDDVYYECAHNGCVITEHDKKKFLPAGQWIAQDPTHRRYGFQMSALYSPFNFGVTWAGLVRQWQSIYQQDGTADKAKLKVFINTRLAEAWEDEKDKVDADVIKSRAVALPLRVVPDYGLVLTFGCDVQKDRIEIQIIAWGRGERIAVVDYHVLWGSPTDAAHWQRLTEYLNQPLTHITGAPMRVEAGLIDSGYMQSEVVKFTRAHKAQKWYASKGESRPNKPLIGKPTKVEVKANGKADNWGAEIYFVGTDTGKHTIYGNLQADAERDPNERRFNFSTELEPPLDQQDPNHQARRDGYYKMLTAEAYDPYKKRYEPIKGQRRNEALDTLVLALAAGHHQHLKVHQWRDIDWQLRERALGIGQQDLFNQTQQPAAKPQVSDSKNMVDFIAQLYK